jgi:multimeric flavodoxin WrbA
MLIMKVIVVSYSFTGNNKALADSIAAEFAAEHINITESKPRTMGAIILDILFRRTPQVNPIADKVEDHDLVLLVGPVWMGQVATPLRAYLKRLKASPGQYAFISISGGALGPNPKLAGELEKRVGKKPAAVIDLHITDLLPSDPKPAMKDTSAYRLSDGDVKSLTDTIVKSLRAINEKATTIQTPKTRDF